MEKGARLDAVRVVVVFAAAQAGHAADVLGLPARQFRRLYLCERSATRGLTRTFPLLDAGVGIRLREADADELSTALVRPCRRARLSGRWATFRRDGDDELRIEAEWTGERSTLAARLTAPRPSGTIRALLSGRWVECSPLSPYQRAFLDSCADVPVESGELHWFGPVRATRWPVLAWCGLELNIERWVVPDQDPLEFLEVSLRVEPEAARIRRLAFETLLRRHGLDPSGRPVDAVRMVLTRLVGRGNSRKREDDGPGETGEPPREVR